MAYLDAEGEGGPPGGNIGKAVLGIMVAAAIGFAYKYATTGFIFGQSGWTVERVDAELRSIADAGPVYASIKANYPGEYGAFLRRLLPAAQSGDRMAIEREGFAFTRQLMINHFNELARAPDADLHEIARGYVALTEVLRRTDESLCAQVTVSGFRPGDRLAPEARAAMARIMALQIAAAKSGASQPRGPRPAVGEADAAQFLTALRGRSPDAADLLADPGRLAAAGANRQCAVGIAVHQTVASLPADKAAGLTVELLRELFGGRTAPPSAANQAP